MMQGVGSGKHFTRLWVKKGLKLPPCKGLLLLLLLPQLTACGTIMSLTQGDYHLYAGVSYNFELIRSGSLFSVLAIIDLPLSFVLDSLLLPLSLTQ